MAKKKKKAKRTRKPAAAPKPTPSEPEPVAVIVDEAKPPPRCARLTPLKPGKFLSKIERHIGPAPDPKDVRLEFPARGAAGTVYVIRPQAWKKCGAKKIIVWH